MIAKTFAPENGAKPFVIMKHRDVGRSSRRVIQPPGDSEHRIT
jgi:hypothetical protein